MSKLLHADNNRMLRSRVFRLGIVSLAALVLLTFALEGDAGTLKRTESGFQGLLLFLPMVCSFIIILFVGHEFAGGAIRNKLIVGHLRSRVYTSWMVVGIGVTVIAMIFSAAMLAGMCAIDGGMGKLAAKPLITVWTVLLCELLSNAAMSLLFAVILPGAKGAVVSFLYQYALLMVFMISMDGGGIGWIKTLSHFFPQGLMGVAALQRAPEKPWLYMLCSLGAAVAFYGVGMYSFRRKDLN